MGWFIKLRLEQKEKQCDQSETETGHNLKHDHMQSKLYVICSLILSYLNLDNFEQ